MLCLSSFELYSLWVPLDRLLPYVIISLLAFLKGLLHSTLYACCKRTAIYTLQIPNDNSDQC